MKRIYVILILIYAEYVKCICDARCSGKNCTSGMDDKQQCYARCTDDSCAVACFGENCTSSCSGTMCKAGCEGDRCISNCTGLACKARCAGYGCQKFKTLW